MKAISDVQFNEALQRIKEETVAKGYTEDMIEIRSESDLHEKLAEILDGMEDGKIRIIRLEDRGPIFGFNSRYAIAHIYKDYMQQDAGLGYEARIFASVIIETVPGIYHISGMKIFNTNTGEWRRWSLGTLSDSKFLTPREVDNRVSQKAVPAGFVQKTIVVQNKLTLQNELAEYIAAAMHDEVIQNGGTERVVLIEDESTMLFAGGRYAIATIYASQYDDPVAKFAYYATIDFVSRGKKYSMTIRFWHDEGQNSYMMEYGDLHSADGGMTLAFDTGEISEQEFIALKSKLISVTVLGGAVTYTTTIAWDALGLSLDADGKPFIDQIWLPFDGVRLLIEKGTEQAKVKIDNTAGGNASIVHLCGFN